VFPVAGIPSDTLDGQFAAKTLWGINVGQRVPSTVGQLVGPVRIPVQTANKLRVLGIDLLGGLATLQIPNPKGRVLLLNMYRHI